MSGAGAAEWIALLAFGWVAYAWVGHPLALLVLVRVARREVAAGDVALPVSVIVTVHDEEALLPAKLRNTLELEAPGPLEVIVASDGSTDATERIAREWADRGVRLVALPERRGKEAAQAAAIRAAHGEILVFSDAAARLEKDALRALLRPFADPSVACVTSEDVVDGSEGEGLYVRYEMAVRRLESRFWSVVGLSGSCFAARRELCEPWPEDRASDFRCALEALRRGSRAVCAPGARARFGTARSPGHEWRRRVRTARRGLAVLSDYNDLLDPRRGRSALLLLGHKVARFTAWIGWAVGGAALLVAAPHSSLAAGAAAALGLGMALALLALLAPGVVHGRAPRVALHLLLVHAATAAACWHHLRGEPLVLWEPTRR